MRRVFCPPRSPFLTYRREVGGKPLPFPLPPPVPFTFAPALHAFDHLPQISVALRLDILQMRRREVLNIFGFQIRSALHAVADAFERGEGFALRFDFVHLVERRGVNRRFAVAAQQGADEIDELVGGARRGIENGKGGLFDNAGSRAAN